MCLQTVSATDFSAISTSRNLLQLLMLLDESEDDPEVGNPSPILGSRPSRMLGIIPAANGSICRTLYQDIPEFDSQNRTSFLDGFLPNLLPNQAICTAGPVGPGRRQRGPCPQRGRPWQTGPQIHIDYIDMFDVVGSSQDIQMYTMYILCIMYTM